ncbi:TetR/AcrR family transcriptional regulator [Bacillus sp. FJAT-45350]|uniref:TetR/AcrR family transcriptional regulator n=1 Tax=Bacillus sp. FJAT-45350 TaxID=2011014 RepID=UPI000BB99287|nr:TetR-like C-terminal domain-containing protein [Bacillus sp. FJAT-45350]
MTSKLDRRKKYTRMVLKNSLMKILKDKAISSVTVKELCELADINRSTFYSHYSDQYELLYKIEEEIIEDMLVTLNKYEFPVEEEALQMTEKMLEYIAENRDICQTLLSENGDTSFQNRVMNIAHRFTVKNWLTANKQKSDISEYVGIFVVSGCINVIKCWLENDLDKSPKELANIIIKITNKGILSF